MQYIQCKFYTFSSIEYFILEDTLYQNKKISYTKQKKLLSKKVKKNIYRLQSTVDLINPQFL